MVKKNKTEGQVTPHIKPRATRTGISTKDQKILWSRAAARCSMPDCKDKLILDVSSGETATLGQMCHIVGEKNSRSNARGISNMPIQKRNKYSNLILLCAKHHLVIDKDEKKYTIELLHSFKDDHELWVEENLANISVKPDELIYSSLIDLLSTNLQLDRWNWFITNAVRQLLHYDFIDSGDIVAERQLATIFPNTKPELETSIIDLMKTYIEYLNQYLSNASLPVGRDYFAPDNSFKKVFSNPNYDYYSKKKDMWSRKNFALLCLYVISVNNFAEAVRAYMNPLFFITKGKFLIVDEFGTHLGEWGSILLPKYEDVQKRLFEINLEIETFERNNSNPNDNT